MKSSPKIYQTTSGDPNSDIVEKLKEESAFGKSKIQYELFAYLYKSSLESTEVSEYSIALDVLGKSVDFDPAVDSSVRANISRLRKNISVYNAKSGKDNKHTISFPLGSYTIEIVSTSDDEGSKSGRNRLLAILVACFIAALFFGKQMLYPTLVNHVSNSPTVRLNNNLVFPTISTYIDHETLVPEDRTNAAVTLRYLEDLFDALDLIDTAPRDRAKYLLRLNYLPDQIILQLHDDSQYVFWSNSYDRPHSSDNETLKALALKLATGVFSNKGPLEMYHAKNENIASVQRNQYVCLSDLSDFTMMTNDLTELAGEYASAKELFDCVDFEQLTTAKEKSSAYSLLAHQYVRDLTNGTNKTETEDPLASALAMFTQARRHNPNVPLYLRLRLNFEQKRADRDDVEFHRLLGVMQTKLPNNPGITYQRAVAHGFYLNEWDKALALYEKDFGKLLDYSDFVNGQPRAMRHTESLPMMAFIMKGDYEMAHKALRYRAPTESSKWLALEITLHCLTNNQEGIDNMPITFSRSLSTYLQNVSNLNYHPVVEEKLLSITAGEACSIFSEP